MPEPPSPEPSSDHSPHDHAMRHSDRELAGMLMRRQAALGLRVAIVFLALVLGLPLLTHFKPDWSQQPVFGFPLSWFLLAILFYPITWALSAYFVHASEQMEAEDAALVREERGP
jgi:uncharacterized membrane protein (DUF485 family)